MYKGAVSPYIPPEITADGFYGEDGFGDLEWPTEPDISIIKTEPAPVVIGSLVTQNPGEIVVIGLGPTTNIALATKLYPSFAKDVKSVYLMGGNFKGSTKYFFIKTW